MNTIEDLRAGRDSGWYWSFRQIVSNYNKEEKRKYLLRKNRRKVERERVEKRKQDTTDLFLANQKRLKNIVDKMLSEPEPSFNYSS